MNLFCSLKDCGMIMSSTSGWNISHQSEMKIHERNREEHGRHGRSADKRL